MKVEYRIKEVKRFVVTRHYEDSETNAGATETKGEYDNCDVAYDVAYALCRHDHESLGYALDDKRIQYPQRGPS